MEDLFHLTLGRDERNEISSLGLAHLGDSVFEVMVRAWLCASGRLTNDRLHRETVRLVCAPAQAARAARMLPLLTEDELACYRRGRNAHLRGVPQHATREQYAKATGLEALFGWLYLAGDTARLNELFEKTMEEENAV